MRIYNCEGDGFVVRGNTDDEVIKGYHEHLRTHHPDMYDDMMSKPKAEHDRMMEGVRSKIRDE